MIRLAGTNEARGGRRFTVLQALIVFAVAGLVAALAIPAFAAQAKTSVLRQNQVTLALQVRTNVVLADDTTPAPDASPATAMSAGKNDEAISAFKKALAFDANNTSAYN